MALYECNKKEENQTNLPSYISETLYYQCKTNDTATSIYTATSNCRILALNSEIIGEAGSGHSTIATIETTGVVVKSIVNETTFDDNTYLRDSTTRLSIIDLEAGDTVTLANSSRTSHINKTHIIWSANNINDIETIYYDAIIDNRRDQNKSMILEDFSSYILWCQQTGTPAASLETDITINGGINNFSDEIDTAGNSITVKSIRGPSYINFQTSDVWDYVSKIYSVYKISGNSTEIIPVLPRSLWDSFTTVQKQAYNLVAVQDSNTGYKRGVLYSGKDIRDTYLTYSDFNNIICEAYTDIFDSSESSWGYGTNNVQFSGSRPILDVSENAVSIPVKTSGTLGYVDLESNDTPFTVYVVMKAVNPTQYSRLISSMSERSPGCGILLYGSTIVVSSWSSDTSTGVSSTNYFVGAIQFANVNSALGVVNNGNIINKTPSHAGRYITLGRTDINPDGTNAEPCDVLVKYIGVVNVGESSSIIQNNISNLYNTFIGS